MNKKMSQNNSLATSKNKGNHSPQKEEILNGGETVKSTLYSQTVEILSEISNVDSTLYSKTVKEIFQGVDNPVSLKFAINLWQNGARMLTRSDKYAKGVVKSAIWFLSNLQKLNSFQELLDAYYDEKFSNPLFNHLKNQKRLNLFQHGEDLAFWMRWKELLKGAV